MSELTELFGKSVGTIMSKIDDRDYRREIIALAVLHHPTCAFMRAHAYATKIGAYEHMEQLVVALLCENADLRNLMVRMHQNMGQYIPIKETNE